jgi:hypothetical protein
LLQSPAGELVKSMEDLERMVALQMRVEAGQSAKDFDASLARAQAEVGDVAANKKDARLGHAYADLAAVSEAVDPALRRNGFVLRFDSEASPLGMSHIRVVAVLSRDGIERRSVLDTPIETTGPSHTSVRMRRIFMLSSVMKKLLFQSIGALNAPSKRAASEVSSNGHKRSAFVRRARARSARVG